jgi:hypothetical protein
MSPLSTRVRLLAQNLIFRRGLERSEMAMNTMFGKMDLGFCLLIPGVNDGP